MDGKEITLIAVLIILALLAWVGYNFLNPIKVAPISLVPSGSTAATNITSQAAINATANANANIIQAQANGINNLQGTIGATQLGAGLGGLISGLSGSTN